MLIREKFPQIEGLIFDMDGVLWKDKAPIMDLKWFFNTISSSGYRFIFATNNSTKNTAQYQEKLRSFGVEINEHQIINSSLATVEYLKLHFPGGGPVNIIGEVGLISTLSENGYFHSEENALAVIVGLDRLVTYEKLRKASIFIRNGVPFLGTNPDKTFPTPQGLVPGAGSLLAAVEAATGIKPIVMGKPQPFIIDIAMSYLQTTPMTTMVIGDRLDTDILAGQNAGCLTTLVMSGVTNTNEACKWSPPPDLILPDAGKLFI